MRLAERCRDTHANRRSLFLGLGVAALVLGDYIIDTNPLNAGAPETALGFGLSALGVLGVMGAGMQQLEVNGERMRSKPQTELVETED